MLTMLTIKAPQNAGQKPLNLVSQGVKALESPAVIINSQCINDKGEEAQSEVSADGKCKRPS